jgi:hypothetical protein
MSNELSTNFAGSDLAALMGFGGAGEAVSSGPNLARLTQIQAPIMQEVVDEDGELEEKVIVPLGAFKLKDTEGNEVYSRSITVRLFANRNQWTQWDTTESKMHKTLMVQTVKGVIKGEHKDTRGTFNLNRPSKYIPDWDSIDDKTKEVLRTVKNTQVIFGKVVLGKAVDAQGNTVKGYNKEIPFVFDLKNNDSKKSLAAATDEVLAMTLLPIEHTIILGSRKETLPSGNKYAVVVASLGSKSAMKSEDEGLARDFIDYIDRANDYVLSEWKRLNKPDVAISPEILDAIVQVEEAPY